MIVFLYGKDSYGIDQKIREITKGYEAKNPSGLNLIKLNLAESKPEEFFDSVKSGSLIPEKKLIIVKNIFKPDSKKILDFLESQNLNKRDDVILIVVNFNDSEKGELFEYLIKKPNQAQNFKPLKPYEIKSWAKQFSNLLGIDLTGEAIDFLVLNCGSDLWRLDGEMRKLADFKITGVISKGQVEELAIPNVSYNVFGLTDALAGRNKKRALEALYAALESGEKPTELLGLLAWQVRNLLRFKSNPDKSSDLKLHPFVLEKTRQSAKFFSVEELKTILSKIGDLDLAFKTGSLNEKTALSLLISEL